MKEPSTRLDYRDFYAFDASPNFEAARPTALGIGGTCMLIGFPLPIMLPL